MATVVPEAHDDRVLGIAVLVDPRWTTVKLMPEVEMMMVALMLIGARARPCRVRHWQGPHLADVRRLRGLAAGLGGPLVHHEDPSLACCSRRRRPR